MAALDCEFWVDHPDFFLTTLLGRVTASLDFASAAWSIVRDSFLSPICIHFHPQTIACAAVLFACSLFDISKETAQQLVDDFSRDRVELKKATLAMVKMYKLFEKDDTPGSAHPPPSSSIFLTDHLKDT
jgi:hypothetical protein